MKIHEELDGNLVDIMALALSLRPLVFQVRGRDQHEVILPQTLHRVADDTLTTGAMLHKIHLKQIMPVQRIVIPGFVSVCYIHEVMRLQWCYLL